MKRPIQEVDPWNRWLTRHVKRLEALGQTPKTVATRRDLVGRFIAYAKEAGVARPEGVSRALLGAYLIHRRENINARGRRDRPRSVNAHLLAVRRFLEFLSKEGLLSVSLVDAVPYVKVTDVLPKDIPTDREVRRMLEAVNTLRSTGFRDRAILEVLYSTGMRRQELVDVTVADVDLARGLLRIERGKGGKGRIVPLGRMAGDWVRRYLLAIRPELVRGRVDPGWLFVSKSGGKMDGESIRQTVVKAAGQAGLEKNITPHALRRACATEMIRHNANPWHVKELLGHEDFSSLDVYARLTILDLKAAHRKHHPRERQRRDEEGDGAGSLDRERGR